MCQASYNKILNDTWYVNYSKEGDTKQINRFLFMYIRSVYVCRYTSTICGRNK